jgi:hypothetical protein
MFGKRKILTDGIEAEAVVLRADLSGHSDSDGIHKWHLKLRARLDDDSFVETECSAYPTGPAGGFTAGDVLPVRYLESDTSLIEVDRDAMLAAMTAGHRAGATGGGPSSM